MNAYRTGYRPVAADVFRRLTMLVSHHICFVRSLGTQEVMAELLAAYQLHTWLLEAFNVAGYVWRRIARPIAPVDGDNKGRVDVQYKIRDARIDDALRCVARSDVVKATKEPLHRRLPLGKHFNNL